MINVRRPLEGLPGLLLLTALVLFGATIGVSLALVCHWVTMQAEVANFLGGVVGAGLGAALGQDCHWRSRPPWNTPETAFRSSLDFLNY